MANEYINIANTLVTTDAGTHARRICFPKKIDCFPTCNLWLKPESDLHNCIVKSKTAQKYINAYKVGDKIHFQTRFFDKFNTNPDIPNNGWGNFMKAEILDFEGNVIYSTLTDFSSEYLVGWSGSFSYQIIVLDTSLVTFTQDTWHVRIWAENLGGTLTEEVYSEPFYAEYGDCGSLVYFESTYTNTDCCGNYYDYPPTSDNWIGTNLFKFSNKVSVLGKIWRDVGTVSYTKFNNNVTESEFQTPWIFRPSKAIPIYLSDWILRIVMGGQQKTINGNDVLVDDLSPTNILEKGGQTFYYDFSFYTTCTTDFYCE